MHLFVGPLGLFVGAVTIRNPIRRRVDRYVPDEDAHHAGGEKTGSTDSRPIVPDHLWLRSTLVA